jgi:integrase
LKKKRTSHNTAVTSVGFLRGFYTHNDVVFPRKWGSPRPIVSKVAKRDEKTSFYKYDAKNDEIVFKNGTLQHFVQNLNFRDQTIVLCLLSSGADATDIFNLKVGFIKDGQGKNADVKRFFWHSNRAKTAQPFKTFFSEEATQFLKRYVEQNRANTSDDELLFPKENDQPLDVHTLSMNFRVAAKKMGYTKKAQASPFRPKRFRHLFRTACAIGQIDNGFTMAFMGHASDVSSGYLEQDSSIFEKMYVKIEPFLTVFGINKSAFNEMSREITGLKDEVAILAKGGEAITNRTTELEAEVKELKEQLKSATQMVYSFEPILNTFNEIANSKEGQALIKKIHEAKMNQELKESQEERGLLRLLHGQIEGTKK